MANLNPRSWRAPVTTTDATDAGLRAYMLRVYNYMLVGLGLTGVVAWLTANTPLQQIFFSAVQTPGGITLQPNVLGWIAIIAPVGLVLLLSLRIQKMSFGAAQATFWGYAALVGISMAMILSMYTDASVAEMFFITAATFGAMSLWGYTTGRDLTGFGSFLFMGLIGILIASFANIFFQSSAVQFVVSVLGVVIFTGLTAYDTQSIKNMYFAGDDGALMGKKAIIGALRLYLDFINLFVMLMRLFGQRR